MCKTQKSYNFLCFFLLFLSFFASDLVTFRWGVLFYFFFCFFVWIGAEVNVAEKVEVVSR